MTILNINKLIHESITSKISDNSVTISLDESFMESIVSEILKSKDRITLETLQTAFPEVFENETHIATLKAKLIENDVFVEGFNDLYCELSTAIGMISSGVAFNYYSNAIH